jgi:hypothetical protein
MYDLPDFRPLFWIAAIATPLALWKLVDIAVWLVRHVAIV